MSSVWVKGFDEEIIVRRAIDTAIIGYGSTRTDSAPAAGCGSCSRFRSNGLRFSTLPYGGVRLIHCRCTFSNWASRHLFYFSAPACISTSPEQQQLQVFWTNQMQEIERTTDFKNHSLPLARIKKIMKADEDVRMISAEAPVIFAKACEMFILELTLRSWINAEENKRRTLQKNDIAACHFKD
ncbi:hypothetical protein ACSBR2_004732 [Camellia fascicularis]